MQRAGARREIVLNRYKSLLKNTGLVSLGTFGSKLLPFILMRLYTAKLSGGDYNTADIITQTARLLIPLAAVGLTEGFFRLAMQKHENEKKQVFTAGFLIFGAGYAALLPLLLIAFIVMAVTGFEFSQYMWLIGVYILTSCLHSLLTQYIRTKDHFAFFSVQGVINTLLVAVFNILFVVFGCFNVTTYVLSVILADLIGSVIVFLWEKLWRDLVPPKQIDREIYRTMVRYSAPLIPMAVSWWVTSVSDRYMVRGFVEDPNVSDYYSAAYKFPTLVTLLCSVFSQAWNYSSVVEDDEKERSKFFSKVFAFYFCLLFVAASFIIAFSKLISIVMLDPSYYTSWSYIPLLAGATVFSSLVTFLGSVYTVRMKSVFSMWTAILGAVLNIILNLLLIPDKIGSVRLAGWGATGAAVATLISYAAVFLVRAVTAKHYVKFKLRPLILGINSVLMLGQIAVMTFSDKMPLWVWIPLQALFVAAFLYLDGRILWKRISKILYEKGLLKKKNTDKQ